MNAKDRWLVASFLAALLIATGCAKKDSDTQERSNAAPISAEELAPIKKAMTQGMQAIGFGNIKSSHAGKECVVEVRTPDGGLQIKPPPPPPGMVHAAGQVTFYRGQLDGVSADSLTVRRAYPTSGNFKKIEIPKGDIRSIYLAP